ncbi:hypothetical protein [Bdellovibrio sp. HCB337]|uniref:hypothetical protein n=1 Tax=Bdellovibrio sp. HCB337 TaxID=3394358 RepID=UPI0039A40302
MAHQEHLDSALKVRTALLNLQKELLNHLKTTFEKENARVVPPMEWLQVIMVAQRFSWLRELTSLVADIDLLTELQEISQERASLARTEVERLFFEDSASEFSKHYMQLMKAGAPFMVTHGQLKESTNLLPQSQKTWTADEALAERKKWHEEHHLQSRKRRS